MVRTFTWEIYWHFIKYSPRKNYFIDKNWSIGSMHIPPVLSTLYLFLAKTSISYVKRVTLTIVNWKGYLKKSFAEEFGHIIDLSLIPRHSKFCDCLFTVWHQENNIKIKENINQLNMSSMSSPSSWSLSSPSQSSSSSSSSSPSLKA